MPDQIPARNEIEWLHPKSLRRVIDLVEDAGLEVNDWGRADNPKYCYNWSFVDETKGVVLNLWYQNMSIESDRIFQQLNVRKVAAELGRYKKAIQERRAVKLDVALQLAWRKKLPVRVIVCDGELRDIQSQDDKASHVRARELDPQTWYVSEYDWDTGDCKLMRGGHHADDVELTLDDIGLTLDKSREVLAEEFEEEVRSFLRKGVSKPEGARHPSRIIVEGSSTYIVRDPKVKAWVLQEAFGVCECCRKSAPFRTLDNQPFLEVHHVRHLSDDGSDTPENVVAVCPYCHRELHHGAQRAALADKLYSTVKRLVQE